VGNWRDKIEESIFVDFSTGAFTGKFISGEEVTTKFGDCIKFTFLDANSQNKIINTKSKRLCGKMKNIPEGSKVKIFRNGEGFDTNYEVEVLESAKKNEDEVLWEEEK